jgi:hypothetical protein
LDLLDRHVDGCAVKAANLSFAEMLR